MPLGLGDVDALRDAEGEPVVDTVPVGVVDPVREAAADAVGLTDGEDEPDALKLGVGEPERETVALALELGLTLARDDCDTVTLADLLGLSVPETLAVGDGEREPLVEKVAEEEAVPEPERLPEDEGEDEALRLRVALPEEVPERDALGDGERLAVCDRVPLAEMDTCESWAGDRRAG